MIKINKKIKIKIEGLNMLFKKMYLIENTMTTFFLNLNLNLIPQLQRSKI
jgi:hypothetical protein